MVSRKSGVSGKQKKAYLQLKRAEHRERDERDDRRAAAAPAIDSNYTQQVSKKGTVNRLSTRFVRDSDASVASRKQQASEPFGPRSSEPLVCSAAQSEMPTRPEIQTSAAAQEEVEEAAFEAWLADLHGRYQLDELSPFEHNLEVWRQLWRVLERSDVIVIVADVRNPLLHVPVALYAHVMAMRPRRKIVIAISKVDLVDPARLQRWHDELGRRFPLAALCDFSSKGRPVGGSTGGGVASRRKSINTPPSNAEKRVVRAYAERVAEACGVELPPEEEGVAGASYGGAASSVVEEGEGEGEGDEGEEGDEEGEEEEEGEEGEESEEGEEEGEEDEEDEGEDEDDDDMLQRMVAGQRRPAKVEGRAEHDSDAADAVVSTASARVATATRVSASSAPAAPTAVEASSAAGHVTIGFVGHPNVGKTSLLNAFVGRKVASVSRTPGHTKHLQTWSLSPTVTVCDSPGLVFPVAGALVRGVNVGARAVYEACGLFPIAQIRETYSAVRLLHASQDLIAAYGLQHSPDLRDEPAESLSPHLFCTALAERKGYRIARGKGALDLHRAGLEVLKDCVDGALCLAFDPPPPSELGVAAAATPAPAAAGVDEKGEEALREVLEELRVWADAQRSRGA